MCVLKSGQILSPLLLLSIYEVIFHVRSVKMAVF